jgi:Tfp pilus assembly protein FimT
MIAHALPRVMRTSNERSRPRLHSLDEQGVTLVELIVYIVVAGVILAGMAGLFANAWTSQAQTTDRDLATGRANVIAASLQTSVRNASALRHSGGVLTAVVATGTTGWQCRAWRLNGDVLQYKTGNDKAALTATPWGSLATGVSGTLAAGLPFSVAGRQLSVGMNVRVNDANVPLSSGVTAQATGGTTSCW